MRVNERDHALPHEADRRAGNSPNYQLSLKQVEALNDARVIEAVRHRWPELSEFQIVPAHARAMLRHAARARTTARRKATRQARIDAEFAAAALARMHPWEAKTGMAEFFAEMLEAQRKVERSACRRFTHVAFKGRNGDTMPTWMVPHYRGGQSTKPLRLDDSTTGLPADTEHPVGGEAGREVYGRLNRRGQLAVVRLVEMACGDVPSWMAVRVTELSSRGKRGPDRQPRKPRSDAGKPRRRSGQ